MSPSPTFAALLMLSLATPTSADDVRRAYERGQLSVDRQHYELAAETFAGAQSRIDELDPAELEPQLVDSVARALAEAAVACHRGGDSRWLDPALEALDGVLKLRAQAPLGYAALRDAVVDAQKERDQLSGTAIAGIAVTTSAAVGGGLLATGLMLGDQAQTNFETGPTREIRDAADRDGVQANRLAVAGGITMGVLLAAGIALLVVGGRRDAAKRRKLSARGPLRPQLTAAGVGFSF